LLSPPRPQLPALAFQKQHHQEAQHGEPLGFFVQLAEAVNAVAALEEGGLLADSFSSRKKRADRLRP
jgi:hypothetical protein